MRICGIDVWTVCNRSILTTVFKQFTSRNLVAVSITVFPTLSTPVFSSRMIRSMVERVCDVTRGVHAKSAAHCHIVIFALLMCLHHTRSTCTYEVAKCDENNCVPISSVQFHSNSFHCTERIPKNSHCSSLPSFSLAHLLTATPT